MITSTIAPEYKEEAKRILAERELSKRRFDFYFKQSWKVIEPAKELKDSWAIGLMCEYAQACAEREIKRLIVNIPPRNGKSSIWTISFPTWVWLNSPHERFMCASYSQGLSTKLSEDRKLLLESDFYRLLAPPEALLSEGSKLKNKYSNSARGIMFSTSMTATSTGLGCSFLVIDDPLSAQEGESKAAREGAIYGFEKGLYTRLNDKENDVIIIVQQRLHELDLVGHVLEEIGGYETLVLPGICERPEKWIYPISQKVVERQIGELLNPEYENAEVMEKLRQTLGEYGFAGQVQQRPAPAGGGFIKYGYLIPYQTVPEFTQIVQSWDTAGAEESDSCPWVGLCFGIFEGGYYLLDMVRKTMLYPDGKRAVIEFERKWKPNAVLIENKSTGLALIPELKRDPSVKAGIIPIDPKGSKQERIFAELPQIEAGRIRVPDLQIFPESRAMLMQVQAEMMSYPRSATVDIIDALSQFLMWIRTSSFDWLFTIYGA